MVRLDQSDFDVDDDVLLDGDDEDDGWDEGEREAFLAAVVVDDGDDEPLTPEQRDHYASLDERMYERRMDR
jgi:hypothetical protein